MVFNLDAVWTGLQCFAKLCTWKNKNIRGYVMKVDGKLVLCENEIFMVLSATIKLGNKRQSKTFTTTTWLKLATQWVSSKFPVYIMETWIGSHGWRWKLQLFFQWSKCCLIMENLKIVTLICFETSYRTYMYMTIHMDMKAVILFCHNTTYKGIKTIIWKSMKKIYS